MTPYTDCFGNEVDLDNEFLYTTKHPQHQEYFDRYYGGNTHELWDKCIRQIGYVYMYMNYFYPHPDWWVKQKPRIEALQKEFSDNALNHRFEDTPENRLWFKKWMFKFHDETENMC